MYGVKEKFDYEIYIYKIVFREITGHLITPVRMGEKSRTVLFR